MLTFVDLFSGGGGASLGALAAGLTPVGAVEYDPEIAACYADNVGPHIACGPVQEADAVRFIGVDVLHASPPCPNFSVANAKGRENEDDIQIARSIARFIRVVRPKAFTLENVPQYRHSESFGIIRDTLHDLGYWTNEHRVNAAHYGVPQTRVRLFLRALRCGLLPPLNPPLRRPPFNGWYAAIADLIDTLPDSQFAPWQIARLPEYVGSVLIDSRNPGQEFGKLYRDAQEPALTVVTDPTPSHAPRAFLVEGTNGGESNAYSLPVRGADEPVFTVKAAMHKGMPRAFIVASNSNGETAYGNNRRDDNEPVMTITTNAAGRMRAFLAGVQGEGGDGVVFAEECAPTITANHNAAKYRAWLEQGVVKSMTPRALARFQSFPDSYRLPLQTKLASRIVGNACPPLMMAALYRGIKEAIA